MKITQKILEAKFLKTRKYLQEIHRFTIKSAVKETPISFKDAEYLTRQASLALRELTILFDYAKGGLENENIRTT